MSLNFNKKNLIVNNTTSKNFSYTKGEVSLNFNLMTDIKTQIKDFKELLTKALIDVSEELERKL